MKLEKKLPAPDEAILLSAAVGTGDRFTGDRVSAEERLVNMDLLVGPLGLLWAIPIRR
jgi:hypothetical protein